MHRSRLVQAAVSTLLSLSCAFPSLGHAEAQQQAVAAPMLLAEAERLLAQAEIDDGLARVSVWRALLIDASARGDLAPFLDQVRSVGAKP